MATRGTLAALITVAVLTNCSGTNATPDPDGGANPTDALLVGDANRPSETGPGSDSAPSWEGLGESCGAGCNLSVCVEDSDQCSSGWCAWDGRYLMDAYCTLPCVNGQCPDDYECVENQLSAGGEYCLKQATTTPDEFGQTCDAQFYPSSCYRGYCAGGGASAGCDVCVKQQLVAKPFCSMECNLSTVPCPDGYECRSSPSAGSGGKVCFKIIPPEEYVGEKLCAGGGTIHCQPGQDYCLAHNNDPGLCPGTGQCLGDRVLDENYCTTWCDGGGAGCPTGFKCVKTGVHPVSGKDVFHCAKS